MKIKKYGIDRSSPEADRCLWRDYPGKLQGLVDSMKKYRIGGRMMFILLGVASTVWFLIRVIPKPSRAAYPCMRVAAPMMSSFVLWLLAVTTSVFSFRRFARSLGNGKYPVAFFFLFAGLAAGVVSLVTNNVITEAKMLAPADFTPNQPVGTATGLHPGRVVWVWNPDATNENMTNQPFDYWYQNHNADGQVIDSMLARGVRDLAGTDNIRAAWDSLFTWFNRTKGRGDTGYSQGEIVVVKLNLTNSVHPGSYSNLYGETEHPEYMDNTPELVFALLRQLVDVCGIPQEDIYLGDNYRAFRDVYWNLCHTTYPDVHYVDGIGKEGREKTKKSAAEVLHFSDGSFDLCLPQHYLDATYLINLAALKSHNSAGITLTAKNHQGSIIKLEDEVSGTMNVGYAHGSLPDAVPDYGSYRHLVDYMGHKDMGGKTFLYLIDGIWGGREFWGKIYKWDMSPFNGDYPSSIFLSQDPVAIESVGFDFLLAELKDKPEEERLPYMAGTDDYLYQAADTTYWPDGFIYDPEKDGTPLKGMGVYEHWSNAVMKEYTRNLGTGEGIELVKTFLRGPTTYVSDSRLKDPAHFRIWPNPLREGEMHLFISNGWRGRVQCRVYRLTGQVAYTGLFEKEGEELTLTLSAADLVPGLYIVKLIHRGEQVSGKIQKL